MGEAKRRRERLRKAPKTCVFCGAVATTLDHVPPKNLFIPPRPNDLVKVPACESCNGGTSAFDEEFRVYLSAKSGPDTAASTELWQKGGLRSVRHNNRLRRELLSGARLWVRFPSGVFQEAHTYRWPVESHNQIIEKITRGLYYNHFGEALASNIAIEISFLHTLPQELKDFIVTINRHHIGGIDRFAYAYARTPEDPEVSVWIYQFYARHWAAAITKPEACDIDVLDAAPILTVTDEDR
jgi:hypothetical protein